MDFLSGMMFGKKVTADDREWIVVQWGIGYNHEEEIAFHLAVPAEGTEKCPAVHLIGVSTKKEEPKT